MPGRKSQSTEPDKIEVAMREIERTLSRKLEAGEIEKPKERVSTFFVRDALRAHLADFGAMNLGRTTPRAGPR
jgi:hypothetical protein